MDINQRIEANEKLPCKHAGCGALRHGVNDLCQEHSSERYEKRTKAARKAVETRRKNNPNWGNPTREQEYERWRARAAWLVLFCVKKGALPSLASGEYACTDCGAVATQYDHRDYARPLDVEPVCRSCNAKRGSAKWPNPGRFDFPKLKHS